MGGIRGIFFVCAGRYKCQQQRIRETVIRCAPPTPRHQLRRDRTKRAPTANTIADRDMCDGRLCECVAVQATMVNVQSGNAMRKVVRGLLALTLMMINVQTGGIKGSERSCHVRCLTRRTRRRSVDASERKPKIRRPGTVRLPQTTFVWSRYALNCAPSQKPTTARRRTTTRTPTWSTRRWKG